MRPQRRVAELVEAFGEPCGQRAAQRLALRTAERPPAADASPVIVVTDGDIAYPPESPPYQVLWVLPAHAAGRFQPPYGRVVAMDPK